MPHRFEWVGTFQGVEVIDDSKATSVQAVRAGLEALRLRQVVLILGGRDKMLDASSLAKHDDHLRTVVGYGEAGQRLLASCRFTRAVYEPSFGAAVNVAIGAAHPGDVLLLSPACTSFDQHQDYAERGQEFRRLVRKRML